MTSLRANTNGTPTSLVLSRGSGLMTERQAKLTLFPIIFILNSPYFLSRIYFTPLFSLLAFDYAFSELNKPTTQSYNSIQRWNTPSNVTIRQISLPPVSLSTYVEILSDAAILAASGLVPNLVIAQRKSIFISRIRV